MPSKTFVNKVTEINGDTQQVIEREATPQEIAAKDLLEKEAIAAEIVRETIKTEKLALLERLGITEEEAKVLFS